MTSARHLMILASAGSGKTYALTGRFIRLLAEGARPERIVALTFTRKAAGGFFDEILMRLADAADDPSRASQLAREIERPELGPKEFLGLLRAVIDALPRLKLGTIDSFFARIIRAFPLELGLAGEPEVLHEHAARLERRRVLRRMFARTGELSEAQREFIEAFKRATFGREEKRLGTQLDAFIDQHHEVLMAAPEAALWGDPGRIWPDGNAWLSGKPDQARALAALRAWLSVNPPGEKQRKRWEDFIEAVETWLPGASLERELHYVLEKALAAWPDLQVGKATLEFDRRKQELDLNACTALIDLARSVVGGELARRLETTRGIHAVLQGYELSYHDAVRRAGRLTFADVQRLLAPSAGAPRLARATATDRLFIDYRLDAEIDHWMLDEFQDTSFGQWSVLKNLIDEAVQDPLGTRSFFCVGDVKQAIYSWREGDPRLFREIYRYYTEAAPGAIAMGHLDESWRSGPAIITMVNEVFGNQVALAELFPGLMSQEWNREWRNHVSARPERNGQATWLLAKDAAESSELTLTLLRELRPLERGLTCAVLVQTNRAATAMADYLRKAGGLPAVAEADLPVCKDNPVGAALLALVQAAAHPGDSLAWEHLQMTPLAEVLVREEVASREQLTQRVLGQIHSNGFEFMVAHWVQKVLPTLAADDVFSRNRARAFVDAARLFDATGSRDISEFVAFMERHSLRESEGAAVVRVMTIHKSKGLGFDVVVIPDLQGTRLDEARGGLSVHKAHDRSVQWIMEPPQKIIVQHDQVLLSHARAAEAEAGYEALSLFYVALTRAKRGLYLICEPPGGSTSKNYPRLLLETLSSGKESCQTLQVGSLRLQGVWAAGDPLWHEAINFTPTGAGCPGPTKLESRADIAKRFQALQPSSPPTRPLVAGLFSLHEKEAATHGIAVHRLLAEVEWWSDPEAWARKWLDRGELPIVVSEVKSVLESKELRPLWSMPSAAAQAEVWREKAFEIVLGDVWVSGVFDRVVVAYDRAGNPNSATVFDFKTSKVAGMDLALVASRHRNQLSLYRQVVSILTNLPLAKVNALIVFTEVAQTKILGFD